MACNVVVPCGQCAVALNTTRGDGGVKGDEGAKGTAGEPELRVLERDFTVVQNVRVPRAGEEENLRGSRDLMEFKIK